MTRDNLSKGIVFISAALGLLTVGGLLAFGGLGFRATAELAQLPWVQPTAQSFMVLSALAIAFLCLGRYRAIGGAWTQWAGTVFIGNGILGIFYLLSWPGLLDGRGVIAQLPNTASWFFMLFFSCVVLLLVAVNTGRPERAKPSYAFAVYAAAAILVILVGLISLRFESVLPNLIVGVDFTHLTFVWSGTLIVLAAIAAASAYRRYLRERDAMLGYVALFLVMMAFGLLDSLIGGKRYDVWWYSGRLVFVAAHVAVLFGFLQEGYSLFSREKERVEERQQLLEQVQVQSEELHSQSEELVAQNEELQTQRKELERLLGQLQVERERWQTTVESMLDMVAVCDARGQVTYINPAYSRHIGYLVDPSLPLEEHPKYYRLYRPGGAMFEPEELPLQKAALTGEEVHEVEVVERTADGAEFAGLFNAAPLHDADGKVVGAVVVGRDVTEQRRAEAERERLLVEVGTQRRLFETVVEQSTAGIAVLSGPEFRFEIANPAYQTIAPGKRLLGRPVAEVWPELADQVLPFLRRVLDTGEPFHAVDMPLPVEREPGRPLEDAYFTFSYVRMDRGQDQGKAILVVVNETTEQVRARQLMEEAVRVRNEFLSIAAHELKTPVTSLRGFAQYITRRHNLTGALDPEQVLRAMSRIDQQTRRLDNLTQELLDVSRVESGKLVLSRVETAVSSVVEAALALVKEVHPERTFLVQDDASVIAFLDPSRMEQVLTNLLDNAVKFSPPESSVKIEVVLDGGGQVGISVRDYGRGVPQGERERIFERFHQAHPEQHYGGMGLGLYISSQIVGMHGGTITCEEPDGGGALFVVRLPLGTRAED